MLLVIDTYGGFKNEIRLKRYLVSPPDYAKTLKLRFRVEDLDLPERRKRYASSGEEEDVDAHMCPCGTKIESRAHVVGECEIYAEERHVLEEEMVKLDRCDTQEFRRL